MTYFNLKVSTCRILLLSLILGPACTARANIYITLANEFPTEYLTTQDTKSRSIKDQISVTNGAKPQLNFEVQKLSREQQRTIVLQLLSEKNPSAPQGQLDAAGRKDLELLNQANLHTRINRAETAFGDIALAKLLIEPTTDVKVLQSRQNIIKQLLRDKNFFHEAQKALQQIAESSQTFLTFWEKSNSVEQGAINGLYFGKMLDPLNKNSFALGARLRLQDFAFIAAIYGGGLSWLLMMKQFIKRTPGLKDLLPLEQLGIDTTISLRNIALSPVDHITDGYKINSYIYESAAQKVTGQALSPAAKARCKAAAAGGAVAGLLMNIWQKKVFLDGILQRKNITNNLQAHLINLAKGLNTLKHISDFILAHNIQSFDAITDLFNDSNKHSEEFNKLMHLLNSNTFKGEASFFSLTGRILVAHKLVQEVKDELRDAFEALGTFDALVSTAKLIQEFYKQRVTFCFAEFVTTDTPYMELTEFWNPLVDSNVVVPNNVALGNPVSTMILTGPNTGGKSTVIKGITLNIVLAQTFGIAAAQSMKLTPFTTINTNINITDNVKENLSLFAAETARAKHVLNEMSALKPNQFGFCVFDETFRGTAPDHAEKLSCWYAKELATIKNIICLHATHYPSMIDLEQQTQGTCKNYKVEIEKLADGSLKRDYILREGSTLHNVAEDILKEQGLIR
jgi:hypothetical protein